MTNNDLRSKPGPKSDILQTNVFVGGHVEREVNEQLQRFCHREMRSKSFVIRDIVTKFLDGQLIEITDKKINLQLQMLCDSRKRSKSFIIDEILKNHFQKPADEKSSESL